MYTHWTKPNYVGAQHGKSKQDHAMVHDPWAGSQKQATDSHQVPNKARPQGQSGPRAPTRKTWFLATDVSEALVANHQG